jgi:hypothetical protein
MENKTKLKIGKETYGKLKIEEAFKKALEPYFKKNESKLNKFEGEKSN